MLSSPFPHLWIINTNYIKKYYRCKNGYIEIEDGIELVRRSFSKIWIDDRNCKKLIKALENYREEFDVKRKVYRGRPLHDWASHAADAMRYLCAALPKTKDGLSSKDIERNYREAMYGDQANMPSIFRTDLPDY